MTFDSRLLFLGGHRKGGTSMFLNMFDGHRALSVYPHDINVLYAYHPRWLGPDYDDAARRERLDLVVCDFFKRNLGKEAAKAGFNVEGFCAGFRARIGRANVLEMASIIEALARTFNETAGARDPAWTVLKETSCEIFAGELLTAFPQARFIHLLRDPRDNYGALKSGVEGHYSRFGEDERMTLSSLLSRARLGMQLAQLNAERFGAKRYCVLRFEDLVREPKPQIERICAFLGIEPEETMTVPTVLGQPTRGNSYENIDFSQVSARNVGRWRDRITAEEACIIEFHFRELLDTYGYKREFSAAAAIDAASAFYKWENDRFHYRDSFARFRDAPRDAAAG